MVFGRVLITQYFAARTKMRRWKGIWYRTTVEQRGVGWKMTPTTPLGNPWPSFRGARTKKEAHVEVP